MKTFTFLVAGLWPAQLDSCAAARVPLLVLGTGLMLSAALHEQLPFQFEETGSLATARYFHTATLLSNGKVLVAGGLLRQPRYHWRGNLRSGHWDLDCHRKPPTPHEWIHTATLLPNGKVLVAGGYNGNETFRERGTL